MSSIMPLVIGANLASSHSRRSPSLADGEIREELLRRAIAEEKRQDMVDRVWLIGLSALGALALGAIGRKFLSSKK